MDEMVVFGVVGYGNRVGGVDGEGEGRGSKDEGFGGERRLRDGRCHGRYAGVLIG